MMDQLAQELLELIFNHLEFNNLMVVRNVVKSWQFAIDNMIEKKPLWIKKLDENSHYYRFFGIQKVYENRHFNVTSTLMPFRLCEEIHSKIKKLITYNPLVLNGLKFENLIHLEIKNCRQISRYNSTSIEFILHHDHGLFFNHNDEEQAITLKFKNLRTFAFKARTDVNFTLDAEQLTDLEVFCDLRNIQIVHPKSVLTLSVGRLSGELLKFKNLKKLIVDNLDFKNVTYNVIKQFTKLKELLIWDSSRNNFDKLIKQGQSNSELKIYYKAIDTSMKDFDFVTINRLNSGILSESNYSTYISHIEHSVEDYSQNILVIQNNLNVQMSYFHKFIQLNCLLVRAHRINLNNWIKLLKILKLNDIVIASNLTQDHLDAIPKYSNKLQRLSIDNYDNLEFVFELKYLTNLTIHEFPNLLIIKRLIEELPCIKQIKIYTNETNSYSFIIMNEMVMFRCRDETVFSDSKISFLQSTILLANSWSDILDIRGNAVMESSHSE